MTLEEFSALTPEEFAAVWDEYVDREERQEKSRWERMRLLATITIQPHVSEKITAPELLPFPWDGDEPESGVEIIDDERRRLAEEALRRIE